MLVSIKQKQWLNINIPIVDCLDEEGVKIPRNGKIYCPFHINTNTPAAKVFEDRNSIYCFTERRHFNVFDLLYKRYEEGKITEEDILRRIPQNIEFNDTVEKEITIPKISNDIRVTYKNSFFEYINLLDNLWNKQLENQ